MAYGIDPNVLTGIKTINDYDQLEQEFQFKKALALQQAQHQQLQTQALQSQVANGGLSLKDQIGFALQSQNQEANRDLRRDGMEQTAIMRQMQMQSMQDARNDKQQQYLQSVAVPGFDIAPGFRPVAKDADEVKKLAGARNVIQTEVGNLRNLVSKNGTEFGFGAEQAAMENSAQRVMLNLKELENLGVLNGPDVEVLAKSFMNPTDLRNQFRDNKTVLDSYDGFEKYINERVSGVAKARGYMPQGSASAAPQAPGGLSLDALLAEKARRKGSI